MEHSCDQCGAPVEDGVAFCPKCNAPQIRVTIAEPAATAPVALEDGALPVAGPVTAARIEWSHAVRSVVWAVLLSPLLTVLAFGSPGLGMLVAGALSVVLYRRGHPNLNLSAGMGARLGAATGALSFVLLLIALSIAVFGFHAGPKIRDGLITAVEHPVAWNPAPPSQQFIDLVKASDPISLAIFGLILTFLVSVAFCTAGGALGALLFRRRKHL